MFVYNKCGNIGKHGSKHQVKDHAVAVGHFQNKDGRSEWRPRNTSEKTNHTTEDKNICIGPDQMKYARNETTNRCACSQGRCKYASRGTGIKTKNGTKHTHQHRMPGYGLFIRK